MRYILALVFCCTLFSCSTNKVTEVNITNENDYPLSVTVRALNCSQTFSGIQPHAEFRGIFDWTTIEKGDGEWIFLIKNENSGGVDSFSHGYFTKGELFSYAELSSKGSQLKVKISE